MIKINLIKDKEKRTSSKGISFKIADLKNLQVQDLLKAGSEYYAGLILWLALFAVIGYYLKISSDKAQLKGELDNLQTEKTSLQSKVAKLREDIKQVQNRIETIKAEISELEKSKDIVVGLKDYYRSFNFFFEYSTIRVPKTSWVSSYRQSLDINQQKLTSEVELVSLDYGDLSYYGRLIEKVTNKAQITQLERRLNPQGFELFSLKLSAETDLNQVR